MKLSGSKYNYQALNKIKNLILDLLFPKDCLSCQTEGEWLCPSCQTKIIPSFIFACPVCQKSQTDFGVCPNCQTKSSLDGLITLFEYRDPIIQRIIHLIKYDFVIELVEVFERSVKNYLGNLSDWRKDFVLLPVPLHRRRRLTRGFNQSELLSELIKKNLGNEISPPILKRVVFKKAQAKLATADRLKNIKGNFIINSKFKGEDKEKNIVIVDDVFTSGATMEECAKVLKENGYKNVWGLALAKG